MAQLKLGNLLLKTEYEEGSHLFFLYDPRIMGKYEGWFWGHKPSKEEIKEAILEHSSWAVKYVGDDTYEVIQNGEKFLIKC